jgi:hypothetical protein
MLFGNIESWLPRPSGGNDPIQCHRDHWLRKLAKAIGQVVSYRHVRKTGKRYEIRDWRFVAPRTKEALIRLADALWEHRGEVAAAKRGG